jgi:CRISPR/Cas system CMR-associated protein Cmr1 (group 7 of RAMP superfamily)
MEALSNLFSLPHSVSVVVPSTFNIDSMMEESEVESTVNAVVRDMSLFFGGATATKGRGGWVSNDLGLVTEDVTIVESNCTESALDAHIGAVVKLCLRLKSDMSQESIALKVDGKLFLV